VHDEVDERRTRAMEVAVMRGKHDVEKYTVPRFSRQVHCMQMLQPCTLSEACYMPRIMIKVVLIVLLEIREHPLG
jgi:hypothetical protein